MNWKFWQRAAKKTQKELWDEIEWINQKMRDDEAARKKAEWDALPDHRKAARIEYRFFQDMAKARNLQFVNCRVVGGLDALQNCNQGYLNQMALSPYAQMSNELGRAIWLEQGGFAP